MEDRLSTIGKRGARVLVVSFDVVDRVREYRSLLNLSFPVAADTARVAYKAYGLTQASFLQTWHPKTLWRYLVLLGKGRKLKHRKKGDDLSQLGADFVVEADGTISYAHYSVRPDDRPSTAEVVSAIATQNQ